MRCGSKIVCFRTNAKAKFLKFGNAPDPPSATNASGSFSVAHDVAEERVEVVLAKLTVVLTTESLFPSRRVPSFPSQTRR